MLCVLPLQHIVEEMYAWVDVFCGVFPDDDLQLGRQLLELGKVACREKKVSWSIQTRVNQGLETMA